MRVKRWSIQPKVGSEEIVLVLETTDGRTVAFLLEPGDARQLAGELRLLVAETVRD
jgi:hypothetical protein